MADLIPSIIVRPVEGGIQIYPGNPGAALAISQSGAAGGIIYSDSIGLGLTTGTQALDFLLSMVAFLTDGDDAILLDGDGTTAFLWRN